MEGSTKFAPRTKQLENVTELSILWRAVICWRDAVKELV